MCQVCLDVAFNSYNPMRYVGVSLISWCEKWKEDMHKILQTIPVPNTVQKYMPLILPFVKKKKKSQAHEKIQ